MSNNTIRMSEHGDLFRAGGELTWRRQFWPPGNGPGAPTVPVLSIITNDGLYVAYLVLDEAEAAAEPGDACEARDADRVLRWALDSVNRFKLADLSDRKRPAPEVPLLRQLAGLIVRWAQGGPR